MALKGTPFADDDSAIEKALRCSAPPGEVLSALEATGHYWKNLFAVLAAAGHGVALLNPLRTHRFAGVDLERTKTDAIDALGIARFAAHKRPAATPLPDASHRGIARTGVPAPASCCRTSAIACGNCTAWSISASPSSPATCAPSTANWPVAILRDFPRALIGCARASLRRTARRRCGRQCARRAVAEDRRATRGTTRHARRCNATAPACRCPCRP